MCAIESLDLLTHSPRIVFVAKRDIEAGTELTIDYEPNHLMEVVTGKDWLLW